MWRHLSHWASRGGRRGGLSVLFFHRVLARHDPLLPDEPTPPQFEAMLGWLRSQFTLLPLPQALQRLRDDTLPPASAALSFDDGYADNLDVAAPLLQRLDIPATFFISTDFADGGLMWNDRLIESVRGATVDSIALPALGVEALPLGSLPQRRAAIVRLIGRLKYLPQVERDAAALQVTQACRTERLPALMMNPQQLRQLAGMGFSMGAHTCSHPILKQLPDAVAQQEISASRKRLESTLDQTVRLFAYPNGREGVDFDSRHCEMARAAGFEAAFTTDAGVSDRNTDPWRLPRFTPWNRSERPFRMQLLRNQFHHGPQAAQRP